MTVPNRTDEYRKLVDAIGPLATKIHETAEKNGWHENWNVAEKMMMVVTELAEAMDEVRNFDPEYLYSVEKDGKPEGFVVELADAFIRMLDITEQYNITHLFADAIVSKVAYNATRPYRHGNKRF